MGKQYICGKCGFEHDSAVNFCTNCGAALRDTCPGCGAEIVPEAKFRGQCGRELGSTDSHEKRAENSSTVSSNVPGGKTPPQADTDKESERRHLTVMFSDLVDSTVLASKLDPEKLQDVLRAYQEVSSEVIDGLDGYMAHYV